VSIPAHPPFLQLEKSQQIGDLRYSILVYCRFFLHLYQRFYVIQILTGCYKIKMDII
jgi:hypothetical protein